MNRHYSFLNSLAVAAAALAIHPMASAQFVGDVFFTEPSIVVPQGSIGYLQLALFTGNKPFGATRASVQYDASKLELVSVVPISNGTLTPKIDWHRDGNTLHLVAVNGQSKSNPFGTVTLAKIGLRPNASIGERIALSSAVQQAYASDRSALKKGSGFGAEISVGVPTASATSPTLHALDKHAPTLMVSPASDLGARAQRLRAPGNLVEIQTPNPRSGATETSRVVVPSNHEAARVKD